MTDFSMNSTHVGHPLHELSTKLAKRVRNLRRRRGLTRLLDLDDHMLDDIGVTRSEIDVARGLPLSMDAATELRRMALERRRRHM